MYDLCHVEACSRQAGKVDPTSQTPRLLLLRGKLPEGKKFLHSGARVPRIVLDDQGPKVRETPPH
jgi:hypothetical protein